MEASLRMLRVLHGAMLFAVVLYAFIGEQAGPKVPRDVTVVQLALMFVSFSCIAIVFFLRKKMLGMAEAGLRVNAQDSIALGRWRAGHILSFAMSESIALFGLVVRMLGGSFRQALPFYVAGLALLVVFRPRAAE
jgi:hypothetical protein